MKTNVLTSLLCTAAAVFAVISLHFVFFYLLRGYDMASYAYQKYYLPMMLYSFLPTPILYYFNKAFVVASGNGKRSDPIRQEEAEREKLRRTV